MVLIGAGARIAGLCNPGKHTTREPIKAKAVEEKDGKRNPGERADDCLGTACSDQKGILEEDPRCHHFR